MNLRVFHTVRACDQRFMAKHCHTRSPDQKLQLKYQPPLPTLACGTLAARRLATMNLTSHTLLCLHRVITRTATVSRSAAHRAFHSARVRRRR